jgi:hypothetical protein
MRKLSWGVLVAFALLSGPAPAQRGEFVQTPWPSGSAPTGPVRTVIRGTISHFADDEQRCCSEIARIPAASREDALAAACRKAFGESASAVKGSTTLDSGVCKANPRPLDPGPRYSCTAPISGRCRF